MLRSASKCLRMKRNFVLPLRRSRGCTTVRSGDLAQEGIDATLLQHVSPIEWDNVILYGQYVPVTAEA